MIINAFLQKPKYKKRVGVVIDDSDSEETELPLSEYSISPSAKIPASEISMDIPIEPATKEKTPPVSEGLHEQVPKPTSEKTPVSPKAKSPKETASRQPITTTASALELISGLVGAALPFDKASQENISRALLTLKQSSGIPAELKQLSANYLGHMRFAWRFLSETHNRKNEVSHQLQVLNELREHEAILQANRTETSARLSNLRTEVANRVKRVGELEQRMQELKAELDSEAAALDARLEEVNLCHQNVASIEESSVKYEEEWLMLEAEEDLLKRELANTVELLGGMTSTWEVFQSDLASIFNQSGSVDEAGPSGVHTEEVDPDVSPSARMYDVQKSPDGETNASSPAASDDS